LFGGKIAKGAAGSAPAGGFGIAPALDSGDAIEVEAVAALLRGLGGLEIGKEGDGIGLSRKGAARGGESAWGDFAAGGFDVGLKFHVEEVGRLAWTLAPLLVVNLRPASSP